MTTARFLSNDDVAGLATPAEFVDVVRDAYREHGTGAPTEPRTTLRNDAPPGKLTSYIAILPERGVMGGYVYPAGFDARDAWFMTPLFDADSGEPLAVLDGVGMNPFKTGAAGAVGVDALARPDASTVGVIGSGAQARGQLQATATVRDLDAVSVYSPTRDNRVAFADEMTDAIDVPVEAVASSSLAVEDADIVITATTSTEPVFDGDVLAPGTHVTAMGQYHPGKREVDSTTIARAKYVPDLAARVMRDAGAFIAAVEDGVVDEDHVYAELGDVVAGTVPGREADDEITLFDSGGTALETVAAAAMLYDRAIEKDLGVPIEFAPASDALTGRL